MKTQYQSSDVLDFSPLIEALRADNVINFKQIIESNPDILTAQINAYCTPMHYVIMAKAISCFEYLLNPNTKIINSGMTFIWDTTLLYGNTEMIELLLKLRPDLCNFDASTLEKVAHQNAATLTLILQHDKSQGMIGGVEVREALQEALEHGNVQKVKLLLQYGANPQLFNKAMFKTAIEHFAQPGSFEELVECLIKFQVDVKSLINDSYVLREGGTLLHTVAENFYEASNEIMKFLLEQGIDPNATDDEGKTPLHYAASGGNVEMCSTLLEYSANLEAVDESGDTPLHKAISKPEVIKFLLEQGANLEVTNRYGQTPYHTAINLKRINAAEEDLDIHEVDFHAAYSQSCKLLLSQISVESLQTLYHRLVQKLNDNSSITEAHQENLEDIKLIKSFIAKEYSKDEMLQLAMVGLSNELLPELATEIITDLIELKLAGEDSPESL